MISIDWLSDRLCEVLHWRVADLGRHGGGPEVPPAGLRVWGMFMELSATRRGRPLEPITHQEIEAWSRLHREPVRPWELEIIRAMDAAFLIAISPRDEGVASRPVQRAVPDERPAANDIMAVFRKAAR